MWVPLTMKVPPLPVTVPIVGALPSPQWMVAVKSLAGADVLLSVNVATVPENGPSTAFTVAVPAPSAASWIEAVPLMETDAPPTSLTPMLIA